MNFPGLLWLLSKTKDRYTYRWKFYWKRSSIKSFVFHLLLIEIIHATGSEDGLACSKPLIDISHSCCWMKLVKRYSNCNRRVLGEWVCFIKPKNCNFYYKCKMLNLPGWILKNYRHFYGPYMLLNILQFTKNQWKVPGFGTQFICEFKSEPHHLQSVLP